MTRLASIALGLFLLLAPAAQAQFGAVETSDPLWRPLDGVPGGQLAVDGSGRASWGSFVREGSDEQMAVYERCGGRTLVGLPDDDLFPVGLKVNAAGDALAVWEQTDTFYSSFRPAGGSWGAQQEIGTTPGSFDFGLADSGDAIAVWNDVGALKAAVRPAAGDWSDTPETVDADDGPGFSLAVRGNGDAIVVGQNDAALDSYFRPAGGSWSEQRVEDLPSGALTSHDVAFDGTGRAVVAYAQSGTVYGIARSAAGAWPANPDVLDSASVASVQQVAGHPAGAAAVWFSGPIATTPSLGLATFGAGWSAKKLYPGYTSATVAAASDGRILVAGSADDEIRGTILSGLTATPPADLDRLSPAKTATTLYRNAVAASGGTHFTLGWGVHGGTNQRAETISTGSCGGGGGGGGNQPPPSPPPPSGGGGGGTTSSGSPPALKLAAFAKLPKASRCVKGRKLKIRLPKPAGFTVKQITIRVNGRRVKRLTKRKQLRGPVTLRRLPKRGNYRVAVAVKLGDGQTITGSLTYRACG